MFRFQNRQERFGIGDVEFGGQPGRRRTVMVGSLFYPRHSMVLDRLCGRVDMPKLEKALTQLEQAARETSTPAAVMLFAETEKAMCSYLEQLADRVEAPLFLDSPSKEVRLAGARKAVEMGIQDRTIYNTLNAGVTEAELEGMAQAGVQNAVLLAFNPADLSTKGKIYLLEEGGGILPKGLIEMAKEAGVRNMLLDMAVLSAEQGAGNALRALFVSKAKWGLPCGCALHNAVESWPPVLEVRGQDPSIFRYVDVASSVIPIMAGADFVMYGPIEYARRSMHASAFADELLRQSTDELRYDREDTKLH
jgi:tetrahydromethanopterin S-methyltransferase subunit H